jgi:glycosyltransferase involved in cell wall biosynthesis
LGMRDDVPKMLMISDLLLFPSLWGGLPGTVLEACEAGTPVLASHIPGIIQLPKHFSKVHSMYLNEFDQRWVSRVTTLLKQKPTDADRLTALKEFEQSDYYIDNCVAAHYSVWPGHGTKNEVLPFTTVDK